MERCRDSTGTTYTISKDRVQIFDNAISFLKIENPLTIYGREGSSPSAPNIKILYYVYLC